jgi:hypothetical protein
MMTCLTWSSGTRSVAEGTDLASVARGLTDEELDKWIDVLRGRTMAHEMSILILEGERRGRDHLAGELFRR